MNRCMSNDMVSGVARERKYNTANRIFIHQFQLHTPSQPNPAYPTYRSHSWANTLPWRRPPSGPPRLGLGLLVAREDHFHVALRVCGGVLM